MKNILLWHPYLQSACEGSTAVLQNFLWKGRHPNFWLPLMCVNGWQSWWHCDSPVSVTIANQFTPSTVSQHSFHLLTTRVLTNVPGTSQHILMHSSLSTVGAGNFPFLICEWKFIEFWFISPVTYDEILLLWRWWITPGPKFRGL